MTEAAKGTSGISADQVRERFADWRRTRAKKARIPDELWDAAMVVVRRDGVNRTAQVLHLDGGKLMRRMVAAAVGLCENRKILPRHFSNCCRLSLRLYWSA